jgi:hypothetical protein
MQNDIDIPLYIYDRHQKIEALEAALGGIKMVSIRSSDKDTSVQI